MADTAKRLYGPAVPGTTDTTLYTVPGATTTVIRNIEITNTTAAAATFNLAINATAATAANCFKFATSIPAGGTYSWSGFIALATTDTLRALQGTASALTFEVSGVEIT